MAGDKKTILDVVKEVDTYKKEAYEFMNPEERESLQDYIISLDKGIDTAIAKGDDEWARKLILAQSKISRDSRVLRHRPDPNKPYKFSFAPGGPPGEDMYVERLAEKALAEKNPTAGGTYKVSVYFSNILPEGKGDIIWTKEAANIVQKASQYGAKKSDILAAQNYFAKIGYMHHSEVDGMPGRQFRGMVSRWNKNATKSTDAIFDAMETWKDNIFGGDKQ